MILCLSESWLDYKANHQGLYVGICGVNPYYWEDYLKDKNIEYNSIKAGQEVFYYYYLKYNDKRKALKKYKGVKNSAKVKQIIDKILRLEVEYQERLEKILEGD